MINRLKITAFVFFCCFSTYAEVYLLSGKKPGPNSGNADFSSAFSPEQIFSEEPVFNGKKLQLSVSLLPITLNELIPQLRILFPDAKVKANANSLLLIGKAKNSWQDRLLIVNFGKGKALMQFYMRVPTKLPENFQLPPELPIPAGVKVFQHVYFPKRKSHYARFTFSGSGAAALRDFDAVLRSDSWLPVSGEANAEYDGRGEIYLRNSPPGIMLVNCAKTKSGFILYSPRKK